MIKILAYERLKAATLLDAEKVISDVTHIFGKPIKTKDGDIATWLYRMPNNVNLDINLTLSGDKVYMHLRLSILKYKISETMSEKVYTSNTLNHLKSVCAILLSKMRRMRVTKPEEADRAREVYKFYLENIVKKHQ